MNFVTEKLDKKELLSSFDETISELLQALSSFNNEELNTIPFEGSWTAAQVTEHLLKSGIGITKILLGNTVVTERRVNENAESLEAIFIDPTEKAKSAESLWPSSENKEKGKLIDDFKAVMGGIRKVIASSDLSQTCLDFPFPTLGVLTRWEWGIFVICHTKKHIYQIKNIRESLEAATMI